MKSVFLMIFIFSLLFSLTCFAQQEASAAKDVDESKANIEKVGKKVSEMPKVRVRHIDKKVISDQQSREVKAQESSEVQKVQKKTDVKKNVVNSKNKKIVTTQKND